MDNFVKLICIKHNSKLKIKINDNRYNTSLYCNFPRNIRKLNQIYEVTIDDIKLIRGNKKDYYYINKKNIKQVNESFDNIKIYSDSDINCIVCLDNEKYYIYEPCGHFYICKTCQINIHKCPICRSSIINLISRYDLRI
ncbi:inhibitor of apoptosis 4 [Mythimna separata entomopoxvirus 'L']|uniref:Inhibitor of apoptosis 4 n=1 Tax=Mythimna separata entomopoxvirus 'L' TaxID=1293572 RepID=A0A916NYK3_9POXV|nr:inhibitor of apoptosis 4 [Mythimna separata entomopoxvirus 'L']CCU56364.1 inhibitor of apoptosis 4 [Mythimna separata entomopoxvirus 'L']